MTLYCDDTGCLCPQAYSFVARRMLIKHVYTACSALRRHKLWTGRPQ